MSRPPIAWRELRRGLILAPNWLGDAAMALPALRALRAATPDCAWTVAGRAAVVPLFELAGWTSLALPPPPSRAWPGPAGVAELALVLPNSWHAALLARASGARRRVGYRRDGRGLLLTDALPRPAPGSLPAHESFYFFELLRRAGALPALPADDAAALRVPLAGSPAAVADWRRRLAPAGEPLAALHVGASFGRAKCWPPDRFAALAGRLAAAGWRVVLIGAAAERALAERVRAGRPGIENLAGQTTLPELAALLEAAGVAVVNDSGPMHLAAALGTPVVALFGSTNDRETCPLTLPGRLRLLKVDGVACRPCKRRECPIDHRCLTRLTTDAVWAGIMDLATPSRAASPPSPDDRCV